MARITRKESHAQTRERLVETAHRLFLADGYNATSLDKVAAEAGYSKGAVYSNFATKHELGLAVLDVLHLERALSLAAAVMARRLDRRPDRRVRADGPRTTSATSAGPPWRSSSRPAPGTSPGSAASSPSAGASSPRPSPT